MSHLTAAVSPHMPPIPSGSPNKFQVLLVDDSEADAKLFETALREAAPRVKLYWVGTATEGIEYLRQQNRFQAVGPVDLVLCDLNMLPPTGFDFIAAVKADPVLKITPLIVYSGSAATSDIRHSYELRVNPTS